MGDGNEEDASEPTEMLELECVIQEGSARAVDDSAMERGLFEVEPSPMNYQRIDGKRKPEVLWPIMRLHH